MPERAWGLLRSLTGRAAACPGRTLCGKDAPWARGPAAACFPRRAGTDGPPAPGRDGAAAQIPAARGLRPPSPPPAPAPRAHLLPLPLQKLLWASGHAGDTPMINFDVRQFARGRKLEKLETLLRPQLQLHWDDLDVFTKGERVSPR